MARFVKLSLCTTVPTEQKSVPEERWWNADLIRSFKVCTKYPGYLMVDYSTLEEWCYLRMSEDAFLRLLTGDDTRATDTENPLPNPRITSKEKTFRSGKRFQNLEYDTP